MKMKNLLMTTIAIFGLAIFTNAQVPNYVPSDGLVGWWPFNGNANDESGSNNNGTVNGASLTSDRFGNGNAAYNYNGIDNFISLPLINLSSYSSFSVSVWVNVMSFQTAYSNHHIIRQHNGIGGLDWLLSFQNNGNIISFGLGIQSQPYTELDLTINPTDFISSWHNIIVTYDGTIKSTFIDGVLLGSELKSGLITYTPSAVSAIGSTGVSVNSVEKFNGKIDDLAIFNRALTQEEIISLYYGSSLDVNEVSQSNLFSVFPNPAQSEINVNLDAKLLGSVFTIYDNIGKAVKTGKLNSVNTTIELNDLLGGIYTFSVGENKKQSFKVIKE
jgi:hypothetical protein